MSQVRQRTLETATYFLKATQERRAIDWGVKADFLGLLLTCNSYAPASPTNQNTSEFCDHRLDRLVRAAEAAPAEDPTTAAKLWQQADQEAVHHAPWVPLVNDLGRDVISRRVGNYQHNPQWGVLLDQLWVH